MMTYLCEHCGAKYQANQNLIDKPCNSWYYRNNSFLLIGETTSLNKNCTYPLQPILTMRIEGIEKETENNRSGK